MPLPVETRIKPTQTSLATVQPDRAHRLDRVTFFHVPDALLLAPSQAWRRCRHYAPQRIPAEPHKGPDAPLRIHPWNPARLRSRHARDAHRRTPWQRPVAGTLWGQDGLGATRAIPALAVRGWAGWPEAAGRGRAPRARQRGRLRERRQSKGRIGKALHRKLPFDERAATSTCHAAPCCGPLCVRRNALGRTPNGAACIDAMPGHEPWPVRILSTKCSGSM